MRFMVIMAIAAVAIFAAALVTLRALTDRTAEKAVAQTTSAPVVAEAAATPAPEAATTPTTDRPSRTGAGRVRSHRASPVRLAQNTTTAAAPPSSEPAPADQAVLGETEEAPATAEALAQRLRVRLAAVGNCPTEQQSLQVLSDVTEGWDATVIQAALQLVRDDAVCAAVDSAIKTAAETLRLAFAAADVEAFAPFVIGPAGRGAGGHTGGSVSVGGGGGSQGGESVGGGSGADSTPPASRDTGGGGQSASGAVGPAPSEASAPVTEPVAAANVDDGKGASNTSGDAPPSGSGGGSEGSDTPTVVGDGTAPGGSGGSGYQQAL